jgi:hypothetical protein
MYCAKVQHLKTICLMKASLIVCCCKFLLQQGTYHKQIRPQICRKCNIGCETNSSKRHHSVTSFDSFDGILKEKKTAVFWRKKKSVAQKFRSELMKPQQRDACVR